MRWRMCVINIHTYWKCIKGMFSSKKVVCTLSPIFPRVWLKCLTTTWDTEMLSNILQNPTPETKRTVLLLSKYHRRGFVGLACSNLVSYIMWIRWKLSNYILEKNNIAWNQITHWPLIDCCCCTKVLFFENVEIQSRFNL